MQTPKDKRSHAVWQLGKREGHSFICFLQDNKVPSRSIMGIKELHGAAAMK